MNLYDGSQLSVDDFFTFGQFLCDLGEPHTDDALVAVSPVGSTAPDVDPCASSKKRSFSIVAGEVECGVDSECTRALEVKDSTDDKGRVERKKSREKKRRVEVNECFDELQKLLATIEPQLNSHSKTSSKPLSSANRTELLTRAIRVIRRIWSDRQTSRQANIGTDPQSHYQFFPNNFVPPSTSMSASQNIRPDPCILQPQGMMDAANELNNNCNAHASMESHMMQMQAMMAAANALSNSNRNANSPAPLPVMMVMPIIMPQHPTSQMPPQATTQTSPAQPTGMLHKDCSYSQNTFLDISKQKLENFSGGSSFRAPQFVSQALDEDEGSETPTHAVCA